MSKRIIWLDDQFYTLHEKFLQTYVNVFNLSRTSLCKCNTLSQFSDELANQNFNGIILDVMLRREISVNDYGKLGQPNTHYQAEQAGIDIAKIIRGIGQFSYSNNLCESIKQLPILILTNENDDPEKQYRREHPDLFEYKSNIENPSIVIHSKGSSEIEDILKNWIETIVKT